MKRFITIGILILVVGSLAAGFTIPALAQESVGGNTPGNEEAWEAMHEACEEGDWVAMAEAAQEAHGEDIASMPCHTNGYYPGQGPLGQRGGMMGRGMMTW